MIYTTVLPCPQDERVNMEATLTEHGVLEYEVVPDEDVDDLAVADAYVARHARRYRDHPEWRSHYHSLDSATKELTYLDGYGTGQRPLWAEQRSGDRYEEAFQCPDTGHLVKVFYQDGKLWAEREDDPEDDEQLLNHHQDAGKTPTEAEADMRYWKECTDAWCKLASPIYTISNLAEAGEFLKQIGVDRDDIGW